MALTFDFSKCADLKRIRDDEWGLTDALIWATMFVGMPRITEDNAAEFYARLHLIECLNGNLSHRAGEPYFITLEDIKRRVGLVTNATPWTRPQFIKHKVGNYFDRTVGKE